MRKLESILLQNYQYRDCSDFWFSNRATMEVIYASRRFMAEYYGRQLTASEQQAVTYTAIIWYLKEELRMYSEIEDAIVRWLDNDTDTSVEDVEDWMVPTMLADFMLTADKAKTKFVKEDISAVFCKNYTPYCSRRAIRLYLAALDGLNIHRRN